MADNERHAVVIFDDGNRLYVQTTVAQIKNRLEAVTTPSLPLINVADEDGRDVFINANHIRELREHVPGEPMVAYGG